MPGFKNKAARTGFNRPQAVAGQEVVREWRNTTVDKILPGDIIAGMGLVDTAFKDCRDEIFILAGDSVEDHFSPDFEVFAFVRKDS